MWPRSLARRRAFRMLRWPPAPPIDNGQQHQEEAHGPSLNWMMLSAVGQGAAETTSMTMTILPPQRRSPGSAGCLNTTSATELMASGRGDCHHQS